MREAGDNWNKIEQEVINYNLQREQQSLSPLACMSNAAVRLQPEKIMDCDNMRPAFFHDTDRIIHSMSYTRYADKTQVFFLFENDHITHRFLHVQLVSKIARTIGRFLRLNEDLIEAIALGHDIGHPPFGHDGEDYLDQLCCDNRVGHFRHNAQSVRFMMDLEHEGKGLNLSLQVLDGILCHNGEFISLNYHPAPTKSWADLISEYQHCLLDDSYEQSLKPHTMEGCVVRVSDVIAYIGRDIEDAIAVRLITRGNLPEEITAVLGSHNREIVDHLITDLVRNSYGKGYLCFSPSTLKALQDLKEFNYHQIYLNPEKSTQNHKIKLMFQMIFNTYLSDLNQENQSSALFRDFLTNMPPNYLEGTPPARTVVDFISGMTDAYFQHQFRELFLPESFGVSIRKSRRP